ncbi:MAG: CinA family protein [Gammaproteobacteria bacterium]|nr:CinA family protein [Gammaproteobacteria bacterium]MBQ0774189.1 CinA family protein [Gammaproteobacteria bacterium]
MVLATSSYQELMGLAEQAAIAIKRQRILLVTAESCTGGAIAAMLTEIPGSSSWFDRGFVSYSNASKQDLLGVSAQTLERFGAVSEEVVREMAQGAITGSNGHLSIAVSGVAGPDGGTADKPVGLVWIAWGQKRGYVEAQQFQFSGDRQAVRAAAVGAALTGLIERLGG